MHAGSIQVRLLGILVIGVVTSLIACSGGAAAPTSAPAQSVSGGIAVAVNPSSSRIGPGDTLSLTATVTGTTDTSVTWSVDGFQDGNATVGTLTGSGSTVTYTAPAAAGTHSVTATSNADSTKKASAAITIQAGVLVTVTPGSATLNSAATLTLTAAVTGTTNTAVTWTVDGVPNGSTTVGALAVTGNSAVYTAPLASGAHTVTATSVADPTQSGSSTLTVQAATTSVTGVIVAPNGVLGNPGTLAAPTTLEGARTIIQNASRTSPGVLRVLLRGGIYPRSSSFTLGSADSGSAANPVEWDA
ncbi:hypothetical protein, partial [Geothrix rubra]|uniref:hypothetical protein n=1 Tax=Geothrix rubra TaxID=2927977 RepID=UPI00255361BD